MTVGRNIFVITPVHGRHEHLRRLRAGLAQSTMAPTTHVVVAMADAEAGAVAAETPGDLQLVELPCDSHALPLAKARNLGVRIVGNRPDSSPDDLLIFLDVDCIPVPDLISAYAEAAEQRPDDLLCGPVAYLPDMEIIDYSPAHLAGIAQPHAARPAPEPGQVCTDGDHSLFWSLSFALRREVWEKIGGFDEIFVGYGAEDTDFARRAAQLGIGLSWVGAARAFHQYHPVSRPPVEHLEEILANGRRFASKWGAWPMEGWLSEFESTGLIWRTSQDYMPVSLTVASVPGSHVYVRHLSHVSEYPGRCAATRGTMSNRPLVRRLPDPTPHRKMTPTGAPWWPPVMLDPEWIRQNDFDLFHVHFGFDAHSPEELNAVVDALDARGAPLVYTAHDLQNPHHKDNRLHTAQLAVLIPRAAAVITLSEQAASTIRQRWGVQPEVVPHPHVVDFETMQRLGYSPLRARDEFRLGIHLKSLRANMVGIPMLEAAVAALSTIAETEDRTCVLQIDIHRDVFDADGARHAPELAAWLTKRANCGVIDLRVHDYYSDEELFAYLSSLHASLLPYRFGTHSGWLEACRDLGTLVIAPDTGCYASQGADLIYHWDVQDDGTQELDTGTVFDAIHAAARVTRDRPHVDAQVVEARLQWRWRQREAIARAHRRIYRTALLNRRS